MAILSVNGLDHMNTASDFFIGRAAANDFTSFSGTVNYLPAGGVNGGGALEITNGAYINGGATSSSDGQGAGGWFKLPLGFSETFIANKVGSQGTVGDFAIRINANGSIDLLGADNGKASLAPPGFIEAGVYYYFNFWHIRRNSGYVKLRINNVTFAVPGDFSYLANDIRYFEGGSITVDDIFVTTTDETDLPPQLIYNLTPSADSTPQDFSFTGAASAWEALDDIKGDGDTSYISSGTHGDVSKFDLSDLPVGVTSVTAVQPYVTASRDGAGANVNASFTVKTAAAANVSTQPIALSTGLYNIYSPAGAVNTAYTPADVNGMTIEFEVA